MWVPELRDAPQFWSYTECTQSLFQPFRATILSWSISLPPSFSPYSFHPFFNIMPLFLLSFLFSHLALPLPPLDFGSVFRTLLHILLWIAPLFPGFTLSIISFGMRWFYIPTHSVLPFSHSAMSPARLTGPGEHQSCLSSWLLIHQHLTWCPAHSTHCLQYD